MRWSIELYGLDIMFTPRIAIKAQVLMDFLAEHSSYTLTILDVEPVPLELNI